MSQYHVNGMNDSFTTNLLSNNTVNSHNNLHVDQVNVGVSDEKSEILAWLSPLEPQMRHHDIRTRRVEDVGDWLLQTEEYRNWFGGILGGDSDCSALFCHGDPGVGKTYISSLVIDRLCDWAKGRNAAVACFYFDFASQKEQSPTSMLGSLLKQIITGLEEIPEKLMKAFREHKKVIGGRRLELTQIVEILEDISSSRPTFICIDALDESTPECRAQLLDSLNRIQQKSPSARIFLAGRRHIRDEVEKRLAGRVAVVSITPTKGDIVRFLRAKLNQDPTSDAMDKSLEEDIIKYIPETVSEIFLLVSLNIELILKETTIHRRREKLMAMKNGLGLRDAYDTTIGRIKAQGEDRSRLGMAALMWISHSERPLKVDEICHALAVEIGSVDHNINNLPSIRTLSTCCQGLVAVDESDSTVRLIHFTLKEYLSNQADLFDKAHSKMAEICLTYLNFSSIKDLPANGTRDLRNPPFLAYASLHWGTHARMELSDRAKSLALELLDRYENHISTKLLWEDIRGSHYTRIDGRPPFSPLHAISYFGIAEIVIASLKTNRWDVNKADSMGMTPLMWAARCGHEEVVALLLKQKYTKPDMSDRWNGRTALSWAAGNGHEGVVRLFLDRLAANPGIIGRRWGKTRQGMSLLFGKRYLNPDRRDKSGRAPLSWAAWNGHEGVVKLLLGREDVDPNRPDNEGRTPLSQATSCGSGKVVKLLLGREDVDPNMPDNEGRNPHSWSASHGSGEVVKLLLGWEDVDPNRLDSRGRTPLSWAASHGRGEAVKFLLGREDVDPDRPDNEGRTPLSWATSRWSAEVAKLLLGREDVDTNRPDNEGRTPLSWAASDGSGEAVKFLLGREDVDPNRPDNKGRTPLSCAAWNGYEGVVKLLLGREDVDTNRPDNEGRTPLWLATHSGHWSTAKLLKKPGNLQTPAGFSRP